MIIHKLIAQHLRHRDDEDFYSLQARDAIEWIARKGANLGSGVRALDLGCGHGIFGELMAKRGCEVTFADYSNGLPASLSSSPFIQVDLDRDDLKKLGQYDLVVCSNVLEHLGKPAQFIERIHETLRPKGHFFLSWTNWLSPWGGHEFSPFHYFGPKLGVKIYDSIVKKQRLHTPYVNLFPTTIGNTFRELRRNPHITLIAAAPRYYTEFSFLVHTPVVREFLTWNCALLLQRR